MRSKMIGRDRWRFTNIRTREWRRLTSQARLGFHLECYADTSEPLFPALTPKCGKYAALTPKRRTRPCPALILTPPSYMRKPPIDGATFLFAASLAHRKNRRWRRRPSWHQLKN